MHEAFPKKFFDRMGMIFLLTQVRLAQ